MHIVAIALTLAALSAQAPARQPQRVEAVAQSAWEALNAGRVAEAERLFDEALKAAPGQPALLVGLAAAAHLGGRADVARIHLVNALDRDPRFTPASLMLGQVLYGAGDLAGAIETYENALRYAPDHPQLTKKLERWRQEASLHERFDQRFGAHFTVLFEGPAEAPLAARAVEILEKAYWKIGAALYSYPPDVITVVLYTREQFRDVTQSPAWAGGAFDGRIRVPVQGALQNLAEFERVLTHELTHAFVRSIAGNSVPQWMDEGLAMYFEGSDRSRRVAQLKSAPERLPLARLEDSFGGFDDARARIAYAESGVAVARLFEEAGTTGVANMLGDLAARVPFGAAFERHAGMTYEAFQQLLAQPSLILRMRRRSRLSGLATGPLLNARASRAIRRISISSSVGFGVRSSYRARASALAICRSASSWTTTVCLRPRGREMTISSPGFISRWDFAGWPLTSTRPILQAFWASERVRKRQAMSSQMSSR